MAWPDYRVDMAGGTIDVKGDVGDFAASTLPGSMINEENSALRRARRWTWSATTSG